MRRAAVLAGGQSSRMGKDKALLELNGVTLLDNAIALLLQSGAEQIMVSGRPTHPLGVADLLPQGGPPAALMSLLHWLETRGQLDGGPLLLIPVDMPLLTPALLDPLWDAAGNSGNSHYQGEVFPCIVQASPVLLGHLRQLFAEAGTPGGQRSMKAVFRFLASREVMMDPHFVHRFVNVNTPADWQGLSTIQASQ